MIPRVYCISYEENQEALWGNHNVYISAPTERKALQCFNRELAKGDSSCWNVSGEPLPLDAGELPYRITIHKLNVIYAQVGDNK